jgi:hypothetical protein
VVQEKEIVRKEEEKPKAKPVREKSLAAQLAGRLRNTCAAMREREREGEGEER